MAVGYAVALGVAGDVSALATLIDAKPNISAAVDSDTVETDTRVTMIKVTGTAVLDVQRAITPNVITLDLGGATGGSCTLTIDGNNSSAINFGDNAAAVDTAVEATTGVTTVTVTGAGTSGDPFVITFAEPEQQRTITLNDSLTGGTGGVLVVPVPNVKPLDGYTIA